MRRDAGCWLAGWLAGCCTVQRTRPSVRACVLSERLRFLLPCGWLPMLLNYAPASPPQQLCAGAGGIWLSSRRCWSCTAVLVPLLQCAVGGFVVADCLHYQPARAFLLFHWTRVGSYCTTLQRQRQRQRQQQHTDSQYLCNNNTPTASTCATTTRTSLSRVSAAS